MKIDIDKLTDFTLNHGYLAEQEIMNLVCNFYKLQPGTVTQGKFSGYDFTIEGKTFELKISSRSTTNSVMEVCRADGRPSGLSASTADYYLFLNNAGNIGKLRLIRTSELKKYYNNWKNDLLETKTVGDKIGSRLAPLNFKEFDDIMILQMDYNARLKRFDTDTAKTNSYAKANINKFLMVK